MTARRSNHTADGTLACCFGVPLAQHQTAQRIAALFVDERGPYAGLPDVDVWGRDLDARLYPGPYRVVAHPPCERWGRYWFGGPSARVRRTKGDDDGCFAAALAAVRQWGGVLEHPAASSAWSAFGLLEPSRPGGWVVADWFGGWTCCVDQGHYGHRAQKATWLYAVDVPLPILTWGKSANRVRLDDGVYSREERRRKIRTGVCQRLSHRERAETPIAFRDLLLGMCRSAESCPKCQREADRLERAFQAAVRRGEFTAEGYPVKPARTTR